MTLRDGFAALAALLLWIAPAAAQQLRVDCGNGNWCPQGHVCLVAGQCGWDSGIPPGGVMTSRGDWCDPGHHESRLHPGRCLPPGYTDCSKVLSCPMGSTCNAQGGCDDGPPQTGPVCGGSRCLEGHVCTSAGACMNPRVEQDCGNGTICSRTAACEHPRGCVYVARQRAPQQPWR